MNTFKPKHTDTYNCLEDVLECLASSYGREHILMYENAWDFYYYDDNKNRKIGNRVEAGEYNAWKSLEINHGIIHKYHFTSNMDKQYEILKSGIKNDNPVVLWLDGYYVPWTNVYQKLHMKHFIIVIDYKSDDEISVVDPYWNGKVNVFNKKFFYLSKAKCITTSLEKEVEIDPERLVGDAVKNTLREENNAFDCMREFAKEVEDKFDLHKELEGFEVLIYNCPLFMQLAEVFFRRKNYAKMLHYLANNYDNQFFESWGKEMDEIGAKWQVTREILVSIAKGKESIDCVPTFVQNVMELADKEEKLAKSINLKLN